MKTKAYSIALVACITIHFATVAQDYKFVTNQVKVEGLVDHSLTINLENINKFRVQRIEKPQNVICASGEVKKEIHSFKGVLLRDILDSAKVKMSQKKTRGEYFIFITASDGYKVIFAWNELYYGPAGENTWLIFEEDKKNIVADGKFVVLCTSDLVTGPRHVKWVKKIEIRRVE